MADDLNSTTAAVNTKQTPIELNYQSIKEYFISKQCRCKYSELFDMFRDLLVDSESDEKFHTILSQIANKKINENNEEYWILKKKHADLNSTVLLNNQNVSLATSSGRFLSNTLQRTKHNLSKIEHRFSNVFTQKSSSHPSPSQSNENLNKIIETTNETQNNSSTNSGSALVKSVKEHAKKLNSLNSSSEISTSNNNNNNNNNKQIKQQMQSKYKNAKIPSYNPAFNYNKQPQQQQQTRKIIEIDSLDLINNPKEHEKEWILVCSRPDSYQDISKLLSKHPYLAQKKDPFNTCAHWACKHNDADVLKLLASTLENDKNNTKEIRISDLINSRTGYTCLHIASIFNRNELMPLLKQYGAQSTPDFSGKLGMDYSISNSFNDLIHNDDRKISLLDFTIDANEIYRRNTTVSTNKSNQEIKTAKKQTNETNEDNQKENFNSNTSMGTLSTPTSTVTQSVLQCETNDDTQTMANNQVLKAKDFNMLINTQ